MNTAPKATEETHWYLLYTNPRSEKKAAQELVANGFEVFLPIQRVLKQWSDRKKWVDEPLFRSYLFIYTQKEKNFTKILGTQHIVKFVSFNGEAVKVNQRDIDLIHILIGNFNSIVSEPYKPKPGDIVEVQAGPLIGQKAKLVKVKGSQQVYIEIPAIMQNVKINIPLNYLKKVEGLESL